MIIEELLPELKKNGYKLIAGFSGINKEANSITFLETKDTVNFLSGKEIIYFTGLIDNSPTYLLSLAQYLEQKKVSGMIIVVGKHINNISEDIIQFFDSFSIPLLSILWNQQDFSLLNKFNSELYSSTTEPNELKIAFENALNYPNKTELYKTIFEKYNFKSNYTYCIGIMEFFEYNHKTKEKKYKTELYPIMCKLLKQKYPLSLCIEYKDKFIFLFAECDDIMARDIISDLYSRLRTTDMNEYIYLGVGNYIADIKNISKSYNQAIFISNLKKKQALKRPIIRFNSLSIYRILASVSDMNVLIDYYNQYLHPLIQFDLIHNTDYFSLLQSLISNNFNISETATILYMHRNSINYKINKIQKILNCDFTSVFDRFNLFEAYRIWVILYKKEHIPDRSMKNEIIIEIPVSDKEKD